MDEITPLLQENGDEQNELSSPPTDVSPCPTLSPGKTHHVFISYSQYDNGFATELGRYLEDEFKLKCMLAEHDFTGGRPIHDNIESAVRQSQKILFLVSEHFLQSRYCDTELNMALTHGANMDLGGFMIFLKIGDFDDRLLPLKLQAFTHIKTCGKSLEEIGQRINATFANIPEFKVQTTAVEEVMNGRLVHLESPVEISPGLCGGLGYEFKDLTRSHLAKLQYYGIQESALIYNNLQESVSKKKLMANYGLFGSNRKRFLIGFYLVSGTIAFVASFGVSQFWASEDNDAISGFTVLGVLCVILCLCLYIGYMVWTYTKMANKIRSEAKQYIDIIERNYLVLPQHGFCGIKIYFFVYDMKPCWEYLKQKAKENRKYASEDRIDEECHSAITEAIMKYYSGKLTTIIPAATVRGHAMYENKCCLCQLVKAPWAHAIYQPPPHMSAMNTRECDPDETCLMKVVGTTDSVGSPHEVRRDSSDTSDFDQTEPMKIIDVDIGSLEMAKDHVAMTEPRGEATGTCHGGLSLIGGDLESEPTVKEADNSVTNDMHVESTELEIAMPLHETTRDDVEQMQPCRIYAQSIDYWPTSNIENQHDVQVLSGTKNQSDGEHTEMVTL